MKDSLFTQPLTGSGPLQSSKRPGAAPEADSKTSATQHEAAAAEFSKEYSAKEKPANDSRSKDETSKEVAPGGRTQLTEPHRPNPDMTAIESGVYRFPENGNPFENALQIRAAQASSESDTKSDVIEADASVPLSTIKSDAAVDNEILIPDIEELLVETTNSPIELTAQNLSDMQSEAQIETIKSAENEILVAQDDAVMDQASKRNILGVVEETLNQTPTRNNRQNLGIDTEPQSELPVLELEDIEMDAIEIEAEGAIDLIDIETQLTTRIDNSAHQTIFPNVAQNSPGQGFDSLGAELAAPTVISGASSGAITQQVSTTASTPVANAIVSTVADAILTAKETPKGVMVQLDPPEMGRVYIDFMFDADNRVNVVVKADNIDSFNILRERSQDFLQMLGDNGFANVDLSFEQQSSDRGSSENDENDQAYGLSYGESAGDTLEASYRTPIYRVNEDQLRLDLRL